MVLNLLHAENKHTLAAVHLTPRCLTQKFAALHTVDVQPSKLVCRIWSGLI